MDVWNHRLDGCLWNNRFYRLFPVKREVIYCYDGTIFLDKTGDMPFDVQANILRVIQTGEVMRIGSKKALKINIRILAATNKNLEYAITDNTFLLDLFYRLNVFNI